MKPRCAGRADSNHLTLNMSTKYYQSLSKSLYGKEYVIMLVPNITNITYGRKVGYKIEQEHFDEKVENISATAIRKEMGLKWRIHQRQL